MTHSILDRITEKNIKRDPLPRAIIENALPDGYYQELAQTFPSLTNVVGTSEGKKCHLPVDALGLILVIHPASIQDRDDALLVLDRHCRALFLFREHTFAHGAYAGDKLHRATANAPWTVEIVNRVRGKPTDRLMRVKMI